MDFIACPCATEDRPAALAILYQHLSEFDRNRQVESILSGLENSESAIELEGLIACRGKMGVVGAMLCLSLPGRVAMGWPPRVLSSAGDKARREILRRLMDAAGEAARRRQARFLQLLLDDVPPILDSVLTEQGYFHLTRLLYVRRPVRASESPPPPKAGVEFVCYREELLGDFTDVVKRSYEGSLDCPELNGVRRMEDVLASHRGSGSFDPNSWFLVRCNARWCGCLLLTASRDRSIEVAYLAVLKEARGRGLGRELARQAIRYAHERDFDAIVLAVDSRNWPALATYEREGFVPWDAREVYLLLLDPAGSSARAP